VPLVRLLRRYFRRAALGGLCWALSGCADHPDARDVATSPEARDDYQLFAARCSKCHSLARPLNSGIDDDEHWEMYVARMRRQPGSGITAEDSVAILRFLHLFSVEERRKKAEKRGEATQPEPALQDAAPLPDAPPAATESR
jgi:hypothetical protein